MHSTVSRRLPAAIRTAALAGVIAITLGACSGGSTPAPTATPGSSPTAAPGALVLDRAPDNLGCDAIGVEYSSVTFHLDPSASPQVWAVTNKGGPLRVRWDSTFSGGTASDPSVLDAVGTVVVRDGDTLSILDREWPELRGYFVCAAPNELFILSHAPD